MNNFKISKNKEWKDVDVNGEIEVIPVGWKVNTIDEIADVVFGQSPENYEDLVRKELTNETIEFHQGNSFFSKKYLKKSNVFFNNFSYLKRALENSIVMSVRAPVGEVNITKKNIVIGRGLAAIEQTNPLTYYILKSIPVQNYMKKISSGSIFESIKSSDFKKIEIINPLSQQTSIATILSAQESIINDMETLVEKYETRLRYLSEELLSGRLRIKEVDGKTIFYKNTEWKEVEVNGEMKEIPLDWEVEKVSDFIEYMSEGGTPPSGDNIYYENGKIPWVVVEDIKREILSTKKNINEVGLKKIGNNLWLPGDLLMSTGATIGNVGIVKTRLATKQGVSGFRVDITKMKQLFLYYLFKNNKELFIRHANGSTFKSLPQKDIKPLQFNVPNMKEQQLISQMLESLENMIEVKKEILEKEKQRFTFLLNNLLSGNYLVEEKIENGQ